MVSKLKSFFEVQSIKPGLFGLGDVLLIWGVYFSYLFSKMLYWHKGGIHAGWEYVWADWPTHFACASRFAFTPLEVWFGAHPFYHAHAFRHHFGANMMPGMLMRAGLDEVTAFVIPSIITALFFVAALYTFYFFVLKSSRQAFFALTLFIAGGGIGFVKFLQDLKSSGLDVLMYPPQQYTKIKELCISCINVVSSELVPQRAFLFGLPIAIVAIMFLLKFTQDKFKNVSTPSLIILGLVIGIMPAIHFFSFLVILICVLVFALFTRNHWKQWLILLASISLPVLVIKCCIFGSEAPRNFFKWYPGWLATKKYKTGLIHFWLVNWGLFLPITIFALWKKRFYKHPLVIAGMIVFILSQMFLFSTWDWNNYKLVTWGYLIFCVPVISYLADLWSSKKLLVVLVFLSMTASGFIDLYRLARTDKHHYRMWSKEEIKLGRKFRKLSKPRARVLTADTHDHWVPCLTGRQIVIGPKAKLWSWGIDYGDTYKDVKKMFSGKEKTKELLSKYKIDYVVIGPEELRRYKANKVYFDENHKKVLTDKSITVYSVKN